MAVRIHAVALLVLVVLVSLFLRSISTQKAHEYNSEEYTFDFKQIGEGIPSSVIFQYDAKQAPSVQ